MGLCEMGYRCRGGGFGDGLGGWFEYKVGTYTSWGLGRGIEYNTLDW